MKKKWWLIILGVLIIAGVGYVGYRRFKGGNANANGADDPNALAQETVIVERDTLRVSVDGSGSLSPQREVAVSFESGGKVVDVLVDVGDQVAAGDVLAQLDDIDAKKSVADAELQVQQSEVNLASAQLQLDELLTWEADESDVKLAQANLDAAQADYERTTAQSARVGDQLTSARVKLEQAQEALEDAQQTYDEAWNPERDWELQVQRYKARLENEREAAESNLERAKDDLEIAQANYNLELAGVSDSSDKNAWSKVVNAEVSLERALTGPEDDDIESARLQVQQSEISLAQAELKLETAQRALADTTLIAPVDGTITELNFEVGQMAGSGQAALILADLETLIVEIGIDETDVAQVSVGQSTLVVLDAFDDVELSGIISQIAPTAKVQSGVVLYVVTIALDPTDLPVRSGMTADVEIVTSSAENVLVVPLKAIRSLGGRSFVLRQLEQGEVAQPLGSGAGAGMGAGAAAGAQGQQTSLGDLSSEERQQLRGQLMTMMEQMQQQGFTLTPIELGVVTDTQAEVVRGLEEGDVVSVASTSGSGSQDDTPGMPPGAGFMMRRP